ncbi:extracellular catalytic domain type 1 short-chain-length polyhydroxyalkanoate depolymerase [Streptomyces beihaiensis]|uniref:PHB depolymerase family esterase n=1 Tax=Streptomyces beihaiensis TaxID=2984495 RepID=A0ABT3U041_9ACTN|nr:PHB depolymerase family esterase [Streptomyces beihaiensis]MCX3061588.1 PHB depolymerase family esterase [Streptomyces beihaiensis]
MARTDHHTPPPGRLRRLLSAAAGAIALAASLLTVAAQPAAAATLTQVTSFGSNPGNLAMYEYAPDNLPTGRPLVVALHGCTQSAAGYHSHSGWARFADQWGFAVVYPQTDSSNNSASCFRWWDTAQDTRGHGEALSVKQMVDKAVSQYGSDTTRIYVTGLSAGGGQAANLLADYPDVFAGGAIDSGLPAQCATSSSGTNACQYNTSGLGLTPRQWGDKVRDSDPGYNGPWPRVAIWQGTADYTVSPVNGDELRDQWTDVWGIGQTASGTKSLTGGTTESYYDAPDGTPAVELYSISGMGHGLAVDPGSGSTQCGSTGAYYLGYICSTYYTATFWGLDGSGGGGGGGGTSPLPAPTNLTVTGTTDTSAALSWSAVSGAASYDLYRDGTKVGSTTSTGYTDTGLTSGTSYTYKVAAVDSAGAEGTLSPAVTATTTGYVAQCYTANNYQQVVDGRAHTSGGYTYANGSDQNMGLYNTYVTHTLKETSAGYYVIADSGC